MDLNATRTALITGGASGLGLATAHVLHAAGCRVVLVDLPSSEGEVRATGFGDRVAFAPADVTDPGQIEAALDTAGERFGGVDIVVNCAGIGWAQRTAGREPHDLEVFRKLVEVNLIGTFNVIRLASQRMIDRELDAADGERGVIVSTASIAAFEGQIGQVAYAASKGGVVGMTLPVARDLARHGIRNVTIAPGLMDTPMLAGLPEATRAALAKDVPYPARLGDPGEYGRLVRHII
ncbi:MAG TPA: SDR family NAD(P)-dependent oxidoreductase, partial [Nitriliruptorales bacterium]